MPESDPLKILLAHNHWATAQLLDACAKLAPEQFHQRFDIGPGSLHDTLAHIIAVMRSLTETLSGTDPRPRLDASSQRHTPEQLRRLLDESAQELSIESRRLPLSDQVIRRTKAGQLLTLTRGAVLAHVTTHGMHHRAQCLNMLRRLGVTPLPPSSVAEWTWLGEGKG